jgi:hypothetical protein
MLVVSMSSPKYILYILIGFVLVVLGAVLPFLMVMRVLESTFFLNFLAYGSSMAGLFLGFIGASLYVNEHRGRN